MKNNFKRHYYSQFFVLFTLFMCAKVFAQASSSAIKETKEDVNKVSSTNELWSFNPLLVTRDPFKHPHELDNTNIPALQRYDIADMQVVAIMSGLGTTKAMIVLPNKESHIVQVDSTIGRHKGTITKITSSEVFIASKFLDNKKNEQTVTNSLKISE